MKTLDSPKKGLANAVYRKALILFPREFRTRYGKLMVQAFSDAARASRAKHGELRVWFVQLRMFAELAARAPREHWFAYTTRRHHRSAHAWRDRESRLRVSYFGAILQDLSYALRHLRKSPGFVVVAVATLAIGIGANTAIFSLVNAVLIRNRPYDSPRELVHVYSSIEGRSAYANCSYQDMLELQRLNEVFDEVGAYAGRLSRVTENDVAQPVFMEAVTQNLFPLLGLEAWLGRVFLPEEDVVPGEHRVVMLGYAYWQRRYAEDLDVLGQSITIAGTPYTIVGVMPKVLESLMLPGVRTDLFVPMKMAASLERDTGSEMYSARGALDVKIIGRLLPGIDIEHARVRVRGLSRQLSSAYPEAFESRSFHVVPTLDVVIQPDFDHALLVPVAALLMTMVGLVLLLTCTNLASLLLARGFDRQREVAVRLALGASRSRLVGQFLTETLVLTLSGCAAGLVVARWILEILTSVQPPFWVPITINHSLDLSVLLFMLAATGTATLLAGIVPALRCTAPSLTPALKGESASGLRRRFNLRNGLLAFQIAISTVLLVGGGLFLRSLQEAKHADRGFSTTDAGVVWLDLGVSGVPESEWNRVAEELTERARSLPGIEVVGATTGIPLAVGAWSGRYDIPGASPPVDDEYHIVRYYCIDQHYFSALGIDLLSGRGIQAGDVDNTEGVAVVSEAAARRFWPGDDPLGKAILSVGSGLPMRVVGVARDVKLDRLDEAPQPHFYLPRQQHQSRSANLLLVGRGAAPPIEIAGDLQRLVRSMDSDLVIMTTSTLEEQFSAMLFPFRAAAGLLAAFGTLALLLAAVGLYGVVSVTVVRRTREVGIRMTLGASTGTVTRTMVRGVLGVLLIGVALGLATALGIGQFLRTYLISVGPADSVTLVSVPMLMLGVALFAALVPARRASKIRPADALRYE